MLWGWKLEISNGVEFEGVINKRSVLESWEIWEGMKALIMRKLVYIWKLYMDDFLLHCYKKQVAAWVGKYFINHKCCSFLLMICE